MPQSNRKNASSRKPRKRNKGVSFLLRGMLVVILIPVAFAGFYLVYPNVSALKEKNPEKTAFMRYREREWKKEGLDRTLVYTWVPIAKISPSVVKAVIISEDDKFWTHDGFDIEALEEAARKNLERKEFAFGASTISQQLAKNLYLTPTKSIIRKVKEAIITWRLERSLSKRRIIELYLNVAEWGEGIFGIEAAARHYYKKPAASLNAQQAAHLAAVLPNPRKWNPTGGSRLVERRARRIHAIMARRGEVEREYDDIMREKPSRETPAQTLPDSLTPAPVDTSGFVPEDSSTRPVPKADSGSTAPPFEPPNAPEGTPTVP